MDTQSQLNNGKVRTGELVLLDFSPVMTPFRVTITSNGLGELGGASALMESVEFACSRSDMAEYSLDTMIGELTEDLDSVGFSYDEICQINAAIHLFGMYFIETLRKWGLYDRQFQNITVRFVGWIDASTAAFEYIGLDTQGNLNIDEDLLERSNSEWCVALRETEPSAELAWNQPPTAIEKAGFLRRHLNHGQNTT